MPQVTSRNVVTSIEPRGELRQHVVLLAHLDTNRCRMAWQSSMVRLLEPLTYLTLAMLASLGLLYPRRCASGRTPVGEVGLPASPSVTWPARSSRCGRTDRTPSTPGAHDNAASVAVALEVASRLAAQPLHRTRAWVAFTGAEETDHAGLYALLRQYPELRNAAFIGLEGLGSGELVYLTRQGLCAHYRPDPGYWPRRAGVAARRPELGARAAEMTGEDEVGTLRRSGLSRPLHRRPRSDEWNAAALASPGRHH